MKLWKYWTNAEEEGYIVADSFNEAGAQCTGNNIVRLEWVTDLRLPYNDIIVYLAETLGNQSITSVQDLKVALQLGEVYVQVKGERITQDEQWGGPSHDSVLVTEDWMAFINKQLNRLDGSEEDRGRFIKIAALAVAAVEAMDNR